MNRDATVRTVVLLNWRDWTHPAAGGAEQYVRMVAEGLAARGWSVTLVAQRYAGAPRESTVHGVRIVRQGGPVSGFPLGLRAARRVLRSAPGARVLESVNTVPFLARRLTGAPTVLMIHHRAGRELATEAPFPLSLGLMAAEEVLPWLARDQWVVTTSPASVVELVRAGHDPARVQVVAPGLGSVPSPPPDTARSPRTVLYLGPLKAYKGVEGLVEAAEQLRAQYPDTEVWIAGRGYLEGRLRSAVRSRGLSDRVRFLGFVSEAEKWRLMYRATIFAYPSVSEGGWSLSVLEAMAAGLPALVGPTLAGMVEEDRGVVALRRDGPDLAARIGEYWDDPARLGRQSAAAARWAREFTSQRTVDGIERLLESTSPSPSVS